MASAAVMTATVTQETLGCSAHIVLARPAHRKQASCSDPPSQILPGLFIGSKEAETSLAALRDAGVTSILQCGVELTPTHKGHFVYKQLAVSDQEDEDIVGTFGAAFDFINEAKKSGTLQAAVLADSAIPVASHMQSEAIPPLTNEIGIERATATANLQTFKNVNARLSPT